MGDKVQRPKPHVLHGLDWGKSFYYTHEADAFIENLEEREEQAYQETLRARKSEASHEAKMQSLHASLIDLIDKTQSCTSGLSFGECLEEIKRRLAAAKGSTDTEGL